MEGWTATNSTYAKDDVGRALYDWFKYVLPHEYRTNVSEHWLRRFFGHEHNYAERLLSIQHGGMLPRPAMSNGRSKRRSKETKKERKAKLLEKRTANISGEKTSTEHINMNVSASEERNLADCSSIVELFDESVRNLQKGPDSHELDGTSSGSIVKSAEASESPIIDDNSEGDDDEDATPRDSIATDNGADASNDAEADADAVEDAALEYDFDDIDLPAGKQPELWVKQKLVVPDPFIPTKVCGRKDIPKRTPL